MSGANDSNAFGLFNPDSIVDEPASKSHGAFLQDEKLRGAVERNGEVWETVASYFEDRTDVQCQHRWTKVVNPQLVKGPWTKEVWPLKYRFNCILKFT